MYFDGHTHSVDKLTGSIRILGCAVSRELMLPEVQFAKDAWRFKPEERGPTPFKTI